MKAGLVYWPALWTGALLHLTVSVVLLSFAVVLGPGLAWIFGTGMASLLIAAAAVAGRTAAGFLNARILWHHQAGLGLCLRTVLGASMIGHMVVFGGLGMLGVGVDGVLTGQSAAALPLVLDTALALAGTAAGALIAADPPRRGAGVRSWRLRSRLRWFGPRSRTLSP